MALLFIFVGKTKEGFIHEGIEKYRALLGKNIQVEVRELKGAKSKEHPQAVEEEGAIILERVLPGDFLVALDERGREFGSVEFAREFGGLLDSGRRTVLAMGGPFGLSPKVKARADLLLSLSKMTFTHEMARLILMEQVYRALTIIKGRTYHY